MLFLGRDVQTQCCDPKLSLKDLLMYQEPKWIIQNWGLDCDAKQKAVLFEVHGQCDLWYRVVGNNLRKHCSKVGPEISSASQKPIAILL